jgi:predicted acylesterase/phospholipase RssA
MSLMARGIAPTAPSPSGEGGGVRDVAIVLSGGSINGVLMELGFLKRVRETPLWDRIGHVYGTSAGALAGTMAVTDRLPDLERFLYELQPEDTFRPTRLWQLPIAGFHRYALPDTIEERLGGIDALAREVAAAPAELVVCVTDVSPELPTGPHPGELLYSSHTTPPGEMAQAILASAAISALVLPLRVGDRIGTDGAWVRNFPLGPAYARDDVALIVSFLYVPRYEEVRIDLAGLRRRLTRFRRLAPARALLAELEAAQERQSRGEPGHHVELIIRLLRLTVARSSALEQLGAAERDASVLEFDALRRDVDAILTRNVRGARGRRLRAEIAERFAAARFPFRSDRAIPRITVSASVGDVSLEAGFRTQKPWSDEAKRALIDRGYEQTDRALRAHGALVDAA